MKVISSFASTFLLLTGFAVLGMISPATAQSNPDPIGDRLFYGEQHVSPDAASTTVDSTNFHLMEPTLLSQPNDVDSLDSIANQINSVFDGDAESDEFFPEGMVVRGGNGSLQLGGEI